MKVFSAKLDALAPTISSAMMSDHTSLTKALRAGGNGFAIAVGSGGSAISAAYLAVCRGSLQLPPTLIQTPLEFVLGNENLSQTQLWLFSAGGENPDILAALDAAISRGTRAVHIVTVNDNSTLTKAAANAEVAEVHLTKTVNDKDGFLATHSVVSAVSTLLAASDQCVPQPFGQDLRDRFVAATVKLLASKARKSMVDRFSSFRPADTLLLLHDPRLSPASILIETSAWEAGLCPVQRTDFRNFAHGRHVWLSKRPETTFVLSLVGLETLGVWKDIESAIPVDIQRLTINHGNCGRFENALAIISGLTVVEALGVIADIDPGRPGVGSFARRVYNAESLRSVASSLVPAVRHKAAAVRWRDDPKLSRTDAVEAFRAMMARLATARYSGLILDYDGTLVTKDGRFNPPSKEIVVELTRLLDSGLRLAFATGRGGSAGEMLRTVIPTAHHDKILMGYYNGAYIRQLDIDIRDDPASGHPALSAVDNWLRQMPSLFFNIPAFKNSGVQITLDIDKLSDVIAVQSAFEAKFGLAAELRLTRSAHTFDICLASTCKTAVVEALAKRFDILLDSILCVGDSGALFGNDYALLGGSSGISVEHVCDRVESCWSLFGTTIVGPPALIKILQALQGDDSGTFRLGVDTLTRATER